MNNMELWNSVCVTDPSAVKAITGKQYKGNSPKPYWIIQRATETFGPCGIGWGVIVAHERFERLTDTDVLHVALVRVWYIQGGKRGELEQMGQTKACYKTAAGGMMVDEDAPKKSVTDGMVKCLSMLGFAGDIFSGQWDDSRYVAWAGEETARRVNPPVDYLFAIKNSASIDVCKSNFAAAWKMSAKADKPALKEAYDRRIVELNQPEHQDDPALQRIEDEAKYQ